MDYEKLANAITEKTKVIIPVDVAGILCDYDKIFKIVEEKKKLFKANNDIQKDGKMSGEFADFTTFSFHAVKNLTTGEGGAAVWKSKEELDNEAIYKQYQLLSLHGQTKDALHKNTLGTWEYDIVDTYYKCNMTDIMAGIGLAQIARYPKLMRLLKIYQLWY